MSDLEDRFTHLEAKVDDGFKSVNIRLRALEDMFNMGKGAAWALAKFVAFIVALATAAAWLWDHFR